MLNLSFCLKSSLASQPLQAHNFLALENLAQGVLDYDIGESNEAVRSLS